jgi:hypothetical protein
VVWGTRACTARPGVATKGQEETVRSCLLEELQPLVVLRGEDARVAGRGGGGFVSMSLAAAAPCRHPAPPAPRPRPPPALLFLLPSSHPEARRPMKAVPPAGITSILRGRSCSCVEKKLSVEEKAARFMGEMSE